MEGINQKKLHEGMRGGGGCSIRPFPSTFETIYPIDTFGSYNDLPLYVQLSVTMWCQTGFHGNDSYINDVTGYFIQI